MNIHTARWFNGLTISLLLLSTVGAAHAAPAASAAALPSGTIVINEFVPAPQSVFTQEKIELYNTTPNAVDISGLWIDDIANGGGAPRQIPSGTIIPGFGFYVHSDSNFLNNGGDDVRLLDTDGTTVLDSYTYTASPGYDASYYRMCDGGAWSNSPNPSPTIGASNGACAGTWVPGTFEVHVFDVEQGDSQLIISPSGKTLLIDVREASWNTGAGAAYIADKLRQIMGPSFSRIDYIMPSHLHLDHIGYAGYGGIWALLEVQGFTVGKLIDRDAGVWVDSDSNGVCNPDTEIVWYNAGTTSGTARNWLCYATNPANATKLNREIAQINSTTQIDLGPDVVVKIVQRDAENVMMADGVTPLRGDHTADAVPPSENDYSIGVKITYGQLDYATAGDSDGEYATSQFGYTYNDVEAVLAPRIGAVDVMRANHHGSGHSTSQLYADTLQPHASFISCGDNTFGHPGQTTLDRLLFWGAVYLTNLCDTTRNYGASVIVNGDIVLKSADGVNYTINGTPYTASNPPTATPTATNTPTNTPTPTATNTPTATPTPTNTPAPTYLDHIVISEFRTRGPGGASDEFVELYNPTNAAVDISGWLIKGSNSSGSVSTRLTIAAGTTLQPGRHFLAALGGGYTGSITPDQTYSVGITDNGGIALLKADGATIVDQVGLSTGSAYKEGAVLTPLTTNTNQGYERKLGGASGSCTDANNNSADFHLLSPSAPQNLSSAAVSCP